MANLYPEEFSNFRPVTNLAFLSKVLERTVANQSRDYLLENNLYPSLQSAYREFYSTETALLRVQNDILREIDKHSEVILVLLDLSAAFDTINHDILLSRLEDRFGFTGVALRWFHSYLRDRTQKVVIGTSKSSSKLLHTGFPQGSMLGPLLFIMYFVPLQDIFNSYGLNCMIYADDLQLYISMKPVSRQSALDDLDLCIKDIMT